MPWLNTSNTSCLHMPICSYKSVHECMLSHIYAWRHEHASNYVYLQFQVKKWVCHDSTSQKRGVTCLFVLKKLFHACMLDYIWCMNAWTCSESGVFLISRSKMSLPWFKTPEKRCHMPICSQKVVSCMHAWLYMMHECMNMLQNRCICNLKVKNEFSMIQNPKKVSHALLIEMSVHACMHSCFKNACACKLCMKFHEMTRNHSEIC